jgi:hypothetical protein
MHEFLSQEEKMKKLLGVLAAGLLVFGVAGQAKAAFTTSGELVRVMYDASTGVEVATDIGSISSLSSLTNQSAFDAISLSAFSDTKWSDVTTAYFGINSSGVIAYVAASATPTVKFGPATWSSWSSAAGSILSTYTTGTAIAGDPNSVSIATSNPLSYYTLFDKGGASLGIYGGALAAGGGAEVNNATGGNQVLWQIVNPTAARSNTSGTIVTAANGPLPGFTIVTTNGATEINPVGSAVPIPPSILLMGSGLLGLIGIGRRKIFG